MPTASRLIFCAAARYRSIKRRRHLQHARDVVEPVARIVWREERGDVHVQMEQIANDVLVFGTIQPVEDSVRPGLGWAAVARSSSPSAHEAKLSVRRRQGEAVRAAA